MWVEWLRDEIMLAGTLDDTPNEGSSTVAEQVSKVRDLFGTALEDYQYRKVLKERVRWESRLAL